jgi:hypothetical protein
MIFLKEKGQAFTAFRFLIAVIMGLAILAIILGIITHFEGQKRLISQKRLFEGFSSSYQSPNGDIIERGDIFIQGQTVYTSGAFSRYVRMPEECVVLSAPARSAAMEQLNSKQVSFTRAVNITVFYQCQKQFNTLCEIECLVSFGEPI